MAKPFTFNCTGLYDNLNAATDAEERSPAWLIIIIESTDPPVVKVFLIVETRRNRFDIIADPIISWI